MFVTNAKLSNLYKVLKSIAIKIPFLGTFLKYIKQKGGFSIKRAIKKIRQIHYRNAPFSDINFMIDTSVNEPQYEYVDHNTWYQHGLAIKAYAGFKKTFKLPVSIEHGVHYYDQYPTYEIENNLPGLFVYSENRKSQYKKFTDKNIIPIGPYIHYAEPILNNSVFEKEKLRLGKSLLIIPSHSDVYSIVSHKNNQYINIIKEISKDFDTVRVCLHWFDVQNKLYSQYNKMGWEYICAGHETNNLFLSRLKSIISLADFIISDNLTTALGYGVYLKKPIFLIKSEMKIKNTAGLPHITDELLDRSVNGTVNQEFFSTFSVYDKKITPTQYALIDKYWGLSSIKTKEEMRNILLDLNEQLLGNKTGFQYLKGSYA